MKGVRGWMLGAVAALAAWPGWAFAEEEVENDYGKAGQMEVGGSLSGSWTSSTFTLGLSPSVGYFLRDHVELSVIGSVDYENVTGDDGERADAIAGSVVLEPSYHLTLSKTVAAFGGLGVGFAYSQSAPAFDLAPRVGLNLDVGSSGVLSPEVSVPILFGDQGGDGAGVSAELIFGAGFTTTF